MREKSRASLLSRREFARALAAGLAGAYLAPPALWSQEEPEEKPILCRATLINGERLNQTLAALSEVGRSPTGGSNRVGFSLEDLAGRQWFLEQMRAAGLEVSVDAAANLRGRREGKNPTKPTLLFGSHIDTVPNGGYFDGCVGSCAALEVMRTLNDQGVATEYPFEMIIFSNEEGVHYGKGIFGSRALAGLLFPGELAEVDEAGVKLAEWVKRAGGDPERIPTMVPSPGTYKAYLELHIEQGGILWQRGLPLGIVEGIVGINRYRCTIEGFANHAGTTPMDQRQDALHAAARLILAVREIVRGVPGRQVGTVGYVRVSPGAPNVIPGRVVMPIELRDLSMEKIEELVAKIRQRAESLAQQEQVKITIEEVARDEGAFTSAAIRWQIQQAALEMRAPTLTMASGAGHDAQAVARLCPIGMLFVPSRDGISHSPQEYSRPEEIACGAEALYRSLLRLDQT
ncbi:MAG: M20 family metallo-hydrolase [Terriglobia bacterium]